MAKDIRKDRREALKNRKNTSFKKAYELGQLPNVKIAVIIRANGVTDRLRTGLTAPAGARD
jgi:hypothetical protein